MEQIGKVWLAGAGPGDAGLLTVKTRSLMDEAEVVVYDALVSTEILSLIPPGKEMIDVGKRQGNHSVPQKEINRILLEKAAEGKKVLRLKGGDPFVFGRGGEEAETLSENGIPFEVIPGVTSAVSVPAYAGIPVTHRGFVSSFHVITGHPRSDGDSRIDYKALAAYGGTLIFLMGVTSLGAICRGLTEAGMDPKTRAAVIEKGTTAGQKKVISRLDSLEDEVSRARIGTPALIVVGEVCSLSEKFEWKSMQPLDGKRIVVTRPRENRGRLADLLRALGAQVIEMPTIRTVSVSANERLKNALFEIRKHSGQEWVVFTSAIGVKIFFEEFINMGIDIRYLLHSPADIKFAAIGAATAGELARYGVCADVVPENYTAKDLGICIAEKAAPYSHVTVVRAENGSKELLPPMLEKGLMVEDIPLYSTEYTENDVVSRRVKTMLEKGEIDFVTFTSASTVRGFVNAVEGIQIGKVCAVCIGKQTREEAERLLGNKMAGRAIRFLTSKEASEEGMLQTIYHDVSEYKRE